MIRDEANYAVVLPETPKSNISVGKNLGICQKASKTDNHQPQSDGQNSFNFHVIKSTQNQSNMQYYMLYSNLPLCLAPAWFQTKYDATEEVPAVFID